MSHELDNLRLALEQTREALHQAHMRIEQLEAHILPKDTPLSPTTSPHLYGQVLDTLLEGCQVIDFDWRYLYVNDMAAQFGRRPKSDYIGHKIQALYPGIEATELFAVLNQCMIERRAQDFEYKFLYPDGTFAWFENRVQPIAEGIFVFTQEITKRKRAEAALHEREEWLSLSMEATDLGTWQHTLQTGTIRFDERARTHYGFASDTVTLDQILARVHPDDHSRLTEEISATTRPQGAGRYSTEYRVIHDDQSVHWLAVQARIVFEGEGDQRTPVAEYGTSQDITAHKRSDEQIRKLNRTVALQSEINQIIVRVRDVEELYTTACEITVTKGGFLGVWIGEVTSDQSKMIPVASAGVPKKFPDGFLLDDETASESPLYRLVHTGKYVVTNGIPLDPSIPIQRRRELTQFAAHSAASFPLKVRGVLRGAITFYTREEEFFDDEEVRLLDELAGDISFAMEFAEQESRRRDVELAVQRYLQRLEVLHEIDFGLLQGDSIETLIDTTLKLVRRLIPCERAGVILIDDVKHEAIFVSVDQDGASDIVRDTRAQLSPDNWFQFDARGLCVIDDIRTLADPPIIYDWAINAGQTAVLHVLLTNDSTPFGAFNLFSHQPGFFTPEYQTIALEISNQLAIVLRQKQMAEKIERHTAELETHVRTRTAELQAAKERVEAILNNSLDGIVFLDSTLHVLQANSSINTLLGYSTDSPVGVPFIEFIHSDDRVRFLDAVRTLPNEQGGQFVEVKLIPSRQLYEAREVEVGIRRVSRGGYVCTIHDISARHKAEAALLHALEVEKQTNVLKSRFVSMASHEFRTPLAGILASTETLSAYRQKMQDHEIEVRLDNIRRQVQYMTGIMEDMLQLGRLQSGRYEFNPQETDLDTICRDVLAEFVRYVPEAARIQYECSIPPVLAHVDRRLIHQALTNLISNAVKYTPVEKPIRVTLCQESKSIVFRITDEGIGIPAEDLGNLFEPFHRASNVGAISGTGLGLSITKRAVEEHKGTLSVDSDVGVGTTFTIILPTA